MSTPDPLNVVVTSAQDKPPVIDAEKAKLLFGLLARNATRAVACHAARIAYTEFSRLMARGERQREGVYRDFRDSVLFWEAAGEQTLLNILNEDAIQNKNTTTAKYLLERRYRKRWAPKVAESPRMLVPPAPEQTAAELGEQLDVQERLARIEALKAIAAERQMKRLGAAQPAEMVEVAVVEPPTEDTP